MASKSLFYYFGDDEAFFRALQGEFKRRTRFVFDFKRVYESEENKIQALFLKVFKENPACVFIDLSKNTQEYLHLARIITRTQTEHKIVTVGLVDYLSPQEIIRESVATGVTLTHIKSAETFDVVFDVMKLISPNEMGEHGFANAGCKEEWEVGIPVKIGYVQDGGIHFETDFKVSPGDRLQLNHYWSDKKIVPSKVAFVKEINSTNLFYNFKYGVDAEFLFVDEFLPPEGMEPDKVTEAQNEREEYITYHKKQLNRWIETNLTSSLEKKAKVLVIDRDFNFYQNRPRTDKYPYTIRCLPYLNDIGIELDKLGPQVIAFSFEKENAAAKNNPEFFGRLIEAVKVKFQDSPPFIIAFNSTTESKQMQQTYKYDHIMAVESELSVDLLLRMADAFDKKLAAHTQAPKKKGEGKVFLKKTNTASVSEILIPIKVIKISETDMIFQSATELTIGMNLHFTTPVDMYVNVQPAKAQGKVPEYMGLIHSMGETEKKELRRFVNTIFFRDHDAQVSAETEEFKKLNEVKLQEKQEASKKAEEEAQSESDTEEKKVET